LSNFRHGHKRVGRATPEYNAWNNLKKRCYDSSSKDYKNYGARGITVCDEWLNSFSVFHAAIGKRPTPQHTIDRIDNSLGYQPGNVRWATRDVQGKNRRNVRRYWVGELDYTLPEIAELFGIAYWTLRARLLRLGWTLERSLGVVSLA